MTNKNKLEGIFADGGTIKARVLEDAGGDIDYIKDAAENGCSGGGCRGLVAYVDTHAFYNEHADEIDEILQEMGDNSVMTRIDIDDIHGDLRNYLAWLAYEIRAQEIMAEVYETIEANTCTACGKVAPLTDRICAECAEVASRDGVSV